MMVQMTKRILSVIPARGGSKGIPKKNIIDLAGKPLIAWTIEASLKSEHITKTIVSSNDKEILDVSLKYGAEVINRPDSLSDDNANSESAVFHAINYLKNIEEVFDIIILLQPTSPLRDSIEIDNAFKELFLSNASGLISVCKYDNKILKAFTKNEYGYLEGICNNCYPFMRRQDLPGTFMSNGAMYIVNINEFVKYNSFYTKKTIPFIMSQDKSIDIDEHKDLENAAKLLSQMR